MNCRNAEAPVRAPVAIGVIVPGILTEVLASACARSFIDWQDEMARLSGSDREVVMRRIGRLYRGTLEGRFESDDAQALALALVNGIMAASARKPGVQR